jgi:phage tail-like protein
VAQKAEDQRALHPLAAYNFRVVVGTTAMRFAKVSGLSREHQTATYRDGLTFLEGERIVKFRVDAYASITLEQGTVAGDGFLHAWLEKKTPTPMEVSLCDAQGTPVLAWNIARALPVKLTAPTLDASTSQLAIESLEIKAAGVTIKDLG